MRSGVYVLIFRTTDLDEIRCGFQNCSFFLDVFSCHAHSVIAFFLIYLFVEGWYTTRVSPAGIPRDIYSDQVHN